MKPVQVSIGSDDSTVLRAECARLGIPVSGNTRLQTLRRELRAYNQRHLLWQRWCKLAEMLFGEEHGIDTTNHNTVIDGVHNRLYERLVAEEMLSFTAVDASTVAVRTTLHSLHDDQQFILTGRQSTRVVDVIVFREGDEKGTPAAVAILYAAQCAFPDVAETVAAWEANKERED